jgi:peptidoglycan/xylan/chitin deacetylase (PgdA/CDA1 family)
LKIAVTIDLENDLGFLESRFGIDEGLPIILCLLERYGVRGTFFVSGESLGYLVETGALGEIARKGHEIASHGYRHTDYRPWEYPLILDELKRSKDSLEDVSGRDVVGFRAPQFLLDERVVQAVRECGFMYDSSLTDGGGISAARYLRKVRVDENLLGAVYRFSAPAESASRAFVGEFSVFFPVQTAFPSPEKGDGYLLSPSL